MSWVDVWCRVPRGCHAMSAVFGSAEANLVHVESALRRAVCPLRRFTFETLQAALLGGPASRQLQ